MTPVSATPPRPVAELYATIAPPDPNAQPAQQLRYQQYARKAAQRAELAATPEGAAQLAAQDAAEDARSLAAWQRDVEIEEQNRFEAKQKLADLRGIPAERGTRAVAFADPGVGRITASRDATHHAMRWRAQNSGEGDAAMVFVLGGPFGVGKTATLARRVLWHRETALYTSAAQIVEMPRNGYSDHQKQWREWRTVDLLAIDELGMEEGDPEAVRALGRLICDRYNDGGVTLCATNMAAGEVAARYFDERLVDRLLNGQRASGLAWFAAVKGPNLRSPKTRAAFEAGK